MTTRRTKTTAGLVLLAGVLLLTGIVWAKATKDTVEGTFGYAPTSWPPPRLWTDEEGVTHMRDISYWAWSTGGLDITMYGTCNHNRDMATGDGDFWGDDHTVEVSWGDLTGTFRGRYGGITVNHAGSSNHSYQGISGDFVGWKLRFDATWDFVGKTGAFEGVLHNPHGE
ncbi:MAG: hypothetical protein JSU70_14750 [Phycisphaerales bacterium]|nr:MAG: hypothetical protein JSU70_14750 [Phycisphaerales bacterium]